MFGATNRRRYQSTRTTNYMTITILVFNSIVHNVNVFIFRKIPLKNSAGLAHLHLQTLANIIATI